MPETPNQANSSLQPASVLIFQGEDDEATVKSKVKSTGGDLNRILIHCRDASPIVLPDGAGFIRRQVKTHKAKLVIIDPLSSFAKGPLSSESSARALTTAISKLAEDTGAAVVVIRHLAKSGNRNPLRAGLGSIALTAAARSVLLVAQHPDDPAQRILAHSKCNLSQKAASLWFEVGPNGIHWIREIPYSAETLTRSAGRSEETALEEAKTFLIKALPIGGRLCSEVQQMASDEGISPRTLQRARKELGITHSRIGFGPGSQVVLHLDHSHPAAQAYLARQSRQNRDQTAQMEKRRIDRCLNTNRPPIEQTR
jgi:hypothetical protein